MLKSFVTQSQKILGDNLIGIYLHGSAVMGCYNEKKSDIDLLVVVKETIPNNIDYSGALAHPGRSSAHHDRSSDHLARFALQSISAADQHTR